MGQAVKIDAKGAEVNLKAGMTLTIKRNGRTVLKVRAVKSQEADTLRLVIIPAKAQK